MLTQLHEMTKYCVFQLDSPFEEVYIHTHVYDIPCTSSPTSRAVTTARLHRLRGGGSSIILGDCDKEIGFAAPSLMSGSLSSKGHL